MHLRHCHSILCSLNHSGCLIFFKVFKTGSSDIVSQCQEFLNFPDASELNYFVAKENSTRSALGRAHLPPTTVFRRLKTTRRFCDGRRITMPNTCTWNFPDVMKFRVAVHAILEKAIRFRHPDYDPDRAQKLISSSMSRQLSTRKMLERSWPT